MKYQIKSKTHNAEVILNVWVVVDKNNNVHSLSAKAYKETGTDEVKWAFLKSKALIDYQSATHYPVQASFFITSMFQKEFNLQNNIGFSHALFQEAIDDIESTILENYGLPLSLTPLICITNLIIDENSIVKPIDN